MARLMSSSAWPDTPQPCRKRAAPRPGRSALNPPTSNLPALRFIGQFTALSAVRICRFCQPAATKQEHATALLQTLLAGGEKSQTEIEHIVQAAGISPSTLRRAAKTPGIKSQQREGHWWWRLASVWPWERPDDHVRWPRNEGLPLHRGREGRGVERERSVFDHLTVYVIDFSTVLR
jgi:hypothetical protein